MSPLFPDRWSAYDFLSRSGVAMYQWTLSLAPAAMLPVTPVPRTPPLLQRMFTVLEVISTLEVARVLYNSQIDP
jgi:hypothetical protein